MVRLRRAVFLVGMWMRNAGLGNAKAPFLPVLWDRLPCLHVRVWTLPPERLFLNKPSVSPNPSGIWFRYQRHCYVIVESYVFKTGRENRSERLRFGKAVPMSLSFSSPLFSLLPYPHFEGSLGCPGFGKEMNFVSLCWLCKDG